MLVECRELIQKNPRSSILNVVRKTKTSTDCLFLFLFFFCCFYKKTPTFCYDRSIAAHVTFTAAGSQLLYNLQKM